MIPGLGISPGEGNDNPLQYSCLKNPVDRGAWRYYAFMVKEEKIIFYKGVFTRRKTVPVAFTSESQRDLFARNYECSYAVSRRQLLHELAGAYQDISITELSRVISEIRRRAISATENSNGAITYSDYLYFDMAEIVFDC